MPSWITYRVVLDNRKDDPLAPPRAPPVLRKGSRRNLGRLARSAGVSIIRTTSRLGDRRRDGRDRVKDGGEPLDRPLLGQVHGQHPLDLWGLRDVLTAAQLLLGLEDGDLLVRVHVHAARRQAVQ
ncbi:hypothetical protein PoMZ_08451 [Pyricularia oryzae]|uniref:Uncharacterized protein n=1 Tax=Pyricularia oryzae TaxID=318829 RepID=A0A4P7NHN6_PYROR|nr:hypothetical protein PoMZ_08451 [Pyricularia oryzae]